MATVEYYSILELSRDCTADEIKKSYRRLALRWHPDRNPNNPQATETFKQISAAYQVLSQPDKRKLYDQYGHAGLQSGATVENPHTASAYSNEISSETLFRHFHPSYDTSSSTYDFIDPTFFSRPQTPSEIPSSVFSQPLWGSRMRFEFAPPEDIFRQEFQDYNVDELLRGYDHTKQHPESWVSKFFSSHLSEPQPKPQPKPERSRFHRHRKEHPKSSTAQSHQTRKDERQTNQSTTAQVHSFPASPSTSSPTSPLPPPPSPPRTPPIPSSEMCELKSDQQHSFFFSDSGEDPPATSQVSSSSTVQKPGVIDSFFSIFSPPTNTFFEFSVPLNFAYTGVPKISFPIVQNEEMLDGTFVPHKFDHTVSIPKGAVSGQEIDKIKYRAHFKTGNTPGDMIVKLKILDHPVFRRNGDELHLTKQIPLRLALLGRFNLRFETLDDQSKLVKIRNSSPVSSGFFIRQPFEGMPLLSNPSHRGDLFVHIDIIFPNVRLLSKEKRDTLESLFKELESLENLNL